jgi:hypothetical protein
MGRELRFSLALVLASCIFVVSPVAAVSVSINKHVNWTFSGDYIGITGSGSYSILGRGRCAGCPGLDLQSSSASFATYTGSKLSQTQMVQTTLTAPPHGYGKAMEGVVVAPPAFVYGQCRVSASMYSYSEATTHPLNGEWAEGYAHAWGAYAVTRQLWNPSSPTAISISQNAGGGNITLGTSAHDDPLYPPATTAAKDPISIEILDLNTNETLTEELFSYSVDGKGLGSWAFNTDHDDGISLELASGNASDAFVGIAFSSSSSWLTSPLGDFSARLTMAGFETTGVLYGQPWQLDYQDGRVVRASLAAQYLPSFDLEYTVPQSIIDPQHQYAESLLFSGETSLFDDQVPEPSSLLALAGGLGCFVPLVRRGK